MATWIDYNLQNYCSTCGLLFDKEIPKCDDCGRRLRVTPRKKLRTKEEKAAHVRALMIVNA